MTASRAVVGSPTLLGEVERLDDDLRGHLIDSCGASDGLADRRRFELDGHLLAWAAEPPRHDR